MGDVADGLMLDLAALAEAAAQEVRLVDLVLVATSCSGYVKRAGSSWHAVHNRGICAHGQEKSFYLVATSCKGAKALSVLDQTS